MSETEQREAEDKLTLEEMFCVNGAWHPEREKGWNEAIEFAIERFGRNSWTVERERYLDIEIAAEALVVRIEREITLQGRDRTAVYVLSDHEIEPELAAVKKALEQNDER